MSLPSPHLPARAVLFAVLDAATYALLVAMAKLLSEDHSPFEIAFYRNAGGLVLLTLYLIGSGQRDKLKTTRLKGHIWRGVIGTGGVIMTFWSFALLPMAEATAIIFAGPLIAIILSAFFLKESVGPRRWISTIIGFGGVLIIVNPFSSGLGIEMAVLVALGAAFANAVVPVLLRSLGNTESALTTVFYFFFIGTIATMPFMFWDAAFPQTKMIPLILGVGTIGLIMQIFKSYSFRIGEASMVAPFIYTRFVWALVLGWLLWADIPSLHVWIGATIIIASNLFIAYREHHLHKNPKVKKL